MKKPLKARSFRSSRDARALLLTCGFGVLAMLGVGMPTAADAQTPEEWVITTYYWSDGWVEHASWDASYLDAHLRIQFDAWNYSPEYSPFWVKFDNVYAYGDLDLPEGLLDDFEDGIIDPIWFGGGDQCFEWAGAAACEGDGVVTVVIEEGPAWDEQNRVVGLWTPDFVIHGEFDVRLDFEVNPEYHWTPNTSFKLILTDQFDYSAVMSLRGGGGVGEGFYQSAELGPTNIIHEETLTQDTQGRLRITRTPAVIPVAIDIKPGSDPNCFNVNGHGVVPVAILGSEELDVYQVDIDSLMFAGLEVRLRGGRGPLCSSEDSDGNGAEDLVCHFEDDPTAWEPGEGTACLTGNLREEFGGTPIEGCDSICIVP